ncbi:methylated-DNA--[protein]-cysteine S-methyltransferase [Georgenia subflava]|uniref:Methylated-DNA--protein-cysteine methyltransferase n=1 Tax=Georgenia subflava TaxID=1622177 RepID=A0A6N7EG28_9MICO|nr:methylated-DNA--[protein]-cysteine S-methyltransferase [Georgenia subflava]MPV35625.1 methylated-DNA--[protein]-cysteine S-methyltransferase [Georgenia subflava]
MRHARISSPVGTLTLVQDDDGVLTAVHLPTDRRAVAPEGLGEWDVISLLPAARELTEYFAGTRRAFTVPVRPRGTAFQQEVWRALMRIPYGQTRTYGQIAHELGLGPRAVRAVGAANGRNPVAILVPCHRVVGADGALTGYVGGVETKQLLLDLERSASTAELVAQGGVARW